MAMTAIELLVERAYQRAAIDQSQNASKIFRYQLLLAVQEALLEFAGQLADGNMWELMAKDFTVAISSGNGGVPTTMLHALVPDKGVVMDNSASPNVNPLEYVRHIQDLFLGGRPPEYLYYTIMGGTGAANSGAYFVIRDKDGKIPTTTSIIVRASFIPAYDVAAGTLADIPAQAYDGLIKILIRMAREKMGQAAAQPGQAGDSPEQIASMGKG